MTQRRGLAITLTVPFCNFMSFNNSHKFRSHFLEVWSLFLPFLFTHPAAMPFEFHHYSICSHRGYYLPSLKFSLRIYNTAPTCFTLGLFAELFFGCLLLKFQGLSQFVLCKAFFLSGIHSIPFANKMRSPASNCLPNPCICSTLDSSNSTLFPHQRAPFLLSEGAVGITQPAAQATNLGSFLDSSLPTISETW